MRAHHRAPNNILQTRGERRIKLGVREHGRTDNDFAPGVALAIGNAQARGHRGELVFDSLLAPEQQRPPGREAGGRGRASVATG